MYKDWSVCPMRSQESFKFFSEISSPKLPSHIKVELHSQGHPEAGENSQNSWTFKQSFPEEEATASLLLFSPATTHGLCLLTGG